MDPILTDWLTIATSGPTADGREISEKTLIEAAESYSRDKYVAFVNCEHVYGNLGEVYSLRTLKNADGKICLQARIRPNKYYLQQNAEDLRLCFSVEIMGNFAKTGKAYLVGLATTDSPSSLGTTVARFSFNKENIIRGEAVEISSSSLRNNPEKPGIAEAVKTVLTEFFTNKKTDQEIPMDPELKKLASAVATLTESVSALNTKVDKFVTQPPSEKTDPPAAPNQPEQKSDINEAITKLTVSVNALKEEFTSALQSLPGKGEKKNPGENTEPLI